MGNFKLLNANASHLCLEAILPFPTRIYQKPTSKQLVLQTQQSKWVIPNTVTMMKCLVEEQNIDPLELSFSSWQECQHLIKQLLLLALEDEYKNVKPSPLGKFARELMATYPKKIK